MLYCMALTGAKKSCHADTCHGGGSIFLTKLPCCVIQIFMNTGHANTYHGIELKSCYAVTYHIVVIKAVILLKKSYKNHI